MSAFAPRAMGDFAALIAAHPLTWIVSNGPTGFVSKLLPLLAECNGKGRVVALYGHFAKRNPHVAALEADPRAAILFQGAEGSMSRRLVSNPTWAPTWNYAVVRFETEVVFVPGETPSAVERLAAHLEGTGPGAWTVAEMGARAVPMLEHIVAFRAHVLFGGGDVQAAPGRACSDLRGNRGAPSRCGARGHNARRGAACKE